MSRATWAQTSFLGGEWSPFMQGRVDHPKYKMALKTFLNALPTEEGAFQRRPGLRHMGRTYSASNVASGARLWPYVTSASVPYVQEITNGHLRLWNGSTLVGNDDSVSVTGISTANPAVVTIASDKGWTSGTSIVFTFDTTGAKGYPDVCAILKNRTFKVTRLTGTTYSLQDGVSGANIDGSTINFSSSHVATSAYSIANVATPWGTDMMNTRCAQNQSTAVITHGSYIPYTMTFTKGSSDSQGTLALTQANLTDGPYLDEDTTGAYLTLNLADATKPRVVQCFISFPTWSATIPYKYGDFVQYDDGGGLKAYKSIADANYNNAPAAGGTSYWSVSDAGAINGSGGFTSADIGRCVRIYSEPALWNSATAYTVGQVVTYTPSSTTSNGTTTRQAVHYVCSAASTNNPPDTSLDFWTPTTSTSVATWTWGRISATGTGLSPRFTVEILGPPLLYIDNLSTYSVYRFRLGVYGSPGVGYPTVSLFHQGRLWFAGAVPNRLDASKPNDYFNMEPTGPDGTVADNNAISATINAKTINSIYWMESIDQGILLGTDGGEWLVSASNLNDPLTPTNIQAHQKTSYCCFNAPAVKTGFSIVFVQKFARKLYEYLADVFSGKFSAVNLTETNRHLTQSSIAEIAYQEEPVPIVWARLNGYRANNLTGMLYRRNSPFMSEQPTLQAGFDLKWGGAAAASFESICVVPTTDGTSRQLWATVIDTNDSSNRHIVAIDPMGDERQDIYTSAYLDDFIVPPPMLETTINSITGLQIYGLTHWEGQSVDAWVAGTDAGTYTVSGGKIFVPYGSDPGGFLTHANLVSLAGSGESFGNYGTYFSAGSGGTAYNVPCAVGHAFTSTGQALRPGVPQEVGTPTGMPLGKTRRAHRYAVQVVNSISSTVSIGTSSTYTNKLKFYAADDQTELNYSQAFTGVVSETLDDDYGLDSMLYWSLSRPYPFTLLAASTFLEGQER